MKNTHASSRTSTELLPRTHSKPFRTFRKLTLILISIAFLISLSTSPAVFRVESRIQSSQSDTLKGTVQAETEDVSGMRRVIFTTERGNKVYVNLPDDIAAGDTVSGTVFAEGAGKTDADRAASLLELKNQTIDIAGWKVPATGGRFELNMPQGTTPDRPGRPCDYWLTWGRFDKRWPCKTLPPNLSTDFSLAPLGQVGKLTQVSGPFDGKFAADDYLKVGDQKMMLLAESPRKMVFLNNSSVVGPTAVEIREQGQVQKLPFRNLKLTMSAQKYNLRRGEQTTLKVVVEGLSDLREPIPLELKNNTPNIMTLGGGNVQNTTIQPSDVRQGGVYQTERMLTGIQVGGFLIQGTVIRDEQTLSSGNNTRSELPLICHWAKGGCREPGWSCLVLFPTEKPWEPQYSGTLNIREGSHLSYEFLSPPSGAVRIIPLKKDVEIDATAAHRLGYKSITILKGNYSVDRRIGKSGGVVFRITARNMIKIDPSNPDNPFDSVGRRHNETLDYLLTRKEKFVANGIVSKDAAINELATKVCADGVGDDRKASAADCTARVAQKMRAVALQTNQSLDKLVKPLRFTNSQTKALKDIEAQIDVGFRTPGAAVTAIENIKKIEAGILKTMSTESPAREIILGSASVARYSTAYWNEDSVGRRWDRGPVDSAQQRVKWRDIARADLRGCISGGIGGAVGGWAGVGLGALTGAIAGSVDKAGEQLGWW